MKVIKLILIFVLLSPCISIACDLCGCFIPKDTMVKGFRFGLAEQYSDFSTLKLDGNEILNPDDQKLNSWNTQFYANYHFNEKFALQLNVPVLYKSFRRPEEGITQNGTESGIGDFSLVGYYVPYQRKNPYSQFTWKVIAGIKFPTGNSDPLSEELEEDSGDDATTQMSGIHGHDIALGTGSYDGILGTDMFGRWNKMFLTGHAQFAIRSTGAFDYRFANDLIWYGGPGIYVATNDTYSLGIQALLFGEYKGEDELAGEKADDTAITAAYFGPLALIGLGQGFMAEAGIGFPLYINNSGLQSVPDYRVRAGITWQFQ